MTNRYAFKLPFLTIIFAFMYMHSVGQIYTFNNAGATGISGPTQAQVNTEYLSTPLAGNVTVSAGIQTWMVPVSGTYKIEVYGANGYGPFAGKGAYMSGEFTFNASDELKILVGQEGGCCVGSGTNQFGGGGGTFVVDAANLPLIVAGGGGGANGNTSILPSSNASITTSGNSGAGTSSGAGGTSGSGGAGISSAGGGGGFTGDGGAAAGNPGGYAFVNGGVGGTAVTGSGGWGGFGGGGGANSFNNRRGGGGGGYSGGGGGGSSTANPEVGGGGGSYNSGTNQVNTPALGTGDGQVIITLLAPAVSVPNNVGLVGFPSLADGACPGLQTITAKVRNFGNNQIDSVMVAWEVDGVLQSNNWYQINLDTFPVLNYDTTITLGTYNFTPGSFDVKAWTSMPNNANDTVNINDTSSVTLVTKLAGTYTINSALPTGGTNFQTFADFTDDLNTYGICGPVIANVSGGPFVETLEFGAISGASATNTIRINGNGATVQFNNTSTERQLLTLSGTKYLTIDSLTFKSLATLYGWGALITGGAAYDSIINCYFDLTSVTSVSSANTNGITFSALNTSATSVGSNGTHCYIGNNHIKWANGTGGGYYTITLAGPSDNNIIENNIFENYYMYGTYINGASGTQILNNEYHKTNKTGSLTTFYGVYSTGITPGLRVMGNRIHHPGGVSGSTSTFYGLYMLGDGTASEPGIIANNAIYEINQGGIMRGIYLSTAPYMSVYHNTVVFDKPVTSSSAVYGIYATGTNTNSEIKNNNIVITGGTTGIKYGFYYSTAASVSNAQKNNIYVNSTQSGTQYYGYYTGAYTTQLAFQTAHPLMEIGSPSVDPLFVAPLTGDFHVQSPLVIGTGEDLLSLVPTDIEGNPRPAAPTIGAFEEPLANLDNASAVTFITPSGSYCSGQQSVSIEIENPGINDITDLKIDWTINGVAQPQVSYNDTLVPTTSTSGQSSDTVVLGNATIPTGTPTIIKAWTLLPNGVADSQPDNDTVTLSFQATEFLTSTTADTTCIGGSAIMTLMPNSGYNVGDLQWQTSANGTTWTDIPNSDNVSYTASNITANSYYRVKVAGGSGVCYSDSVAVAVVIVDIVTTTPDERCGDGTVDLSATATAGSTIYWYDQPTGGAAVGTGSTFTTPNLTATTTYYAVANLSGQAGCESARSPVIATINPLPVVDLGNDTVICTNATIILDAENSGSTYLWDDNSTNQTLSINSAGTYSVLVTGTNLCTNTDTIEVAAGVEPINNLSAVTDLCEDETATLDAGNTGSTYLWSTLETTQTIDVNSGGTFDVLITSPDACTLNTSTTITMRPLPIVDLGADTAICAIDPLELDAGNTGMSFQWSTGDTTQTIWTSSPDDYFVTVTSQYNCHASDTITIINLPTPTTDGFDFIPLINEQLLKVNFAAINPQNVTSYEWDFGDGTPNSNAISPTHTYAASGIYLVTLKVTNECGFQETSLTLNVQAVGISKVSNAAINFSLYPNPSRAEITLENNTEGLTIQHLSIYNVLGAVVYERETNLNNTQIVNVANLASGIYTIKIQTNQGLVVKKFEVIK